MPPYGPVPFEQPLRPAGAHTEARPYDERDRQSPQPDCERGAGASPAKDGEPDPPRPCRNRPVEHRQAGSRANRTSAPAGAATASADTGLPAGAESDRTEPPTAAGGRKGPGRAGPRQAASPQARPPAPAAHPARQGAGGRRLPDQPPPPRRGRGRPVTPRAVTCRPPAGPCPAHSGPRRPLIRPRLSPPRRPRPLPPRRFRVAPGRGGVSRHGDEVG